jgi:hypothetical protein
MEVKTKVEILEPLVCNFDGAGVADFTFRATSRIKKELLRLNTVINVIDILMKG